MSFAEITVYAAVCDICGDRAEYEEYSGYATQGEALVAATDWIIDALGRMLCTACRPCAECGRAGGYSDSTVFLCDSCWRAPCPTCGHDRQLHIAPEHCFHQKCRCLGFPDDHIEVSS